jgi:hypothetical protein
MAFEVGISKHWKIDLLPVREISQDGLGIGADCNQFDSLFLERRFSALQLDQLAFAVWSPIGRTEKKKDRALGPLSALQILVAAN